MPIVSITSAVIEGDCLTVTFDSHAYGGTATDRLFLFVYSSALCAGILADPVLRSTGRITVDLPTEWLGQPLHLYTFLQGYRLRTSDSVHKKLEI